MIVYVASLVEIDDRDKGDIPLVDYQDALLS